MGGGGAREAQAPPDFYSLICMILKCVRNIMIRIIILCKLSKNVYSATVPLIYIGIIS